MGAFGRLSTSAERDAWVGHARERAGRQRAIELLRLVRPSRVVRKPVEEVTGRPFRFTEELFASAHDVPDLEPADVTAEVRGLMEVALVLFNTNEFAHVD